MSYAAAFVDLDGTVWRGRSAVPGASAGLRTLRDAAVPIVFLTNNTGVRRDAVTSRLDAIGVAYEDEPVVTAAWATAAYLAEHRPDASVHVMGRDTVEAEIEDAGLDVSAEGPADVVVVGYDDRVSFARLTAALRAFGPGTVFVATNRDRTTPSEDGPIPGANAFVSAVSGMVEQDPVVLGKPETRMAELAAARHDVPVHDCLMIGDNLETDILMGERAGMDTALVCSGVSTRDDVAASDVEPTYVIDDLGEIASLL
ncbi:phosphoglycolate phosphatase [Halarchaeum acidiphilum MH1-52-1]|uniref:Phosphoglycolate phosphatase n=1 Tax=Halarchaeum acidiphilum MH1-52-1 TaxID=1261545 RepID=U2YD31_9EURY|nr:HAD-IIA family hydrolase [Halarchaeum acidiphilum]GAD51556.1 phosphoglycolate phosphatase [Halarchaeum acidiphilum MH1-52-1]